MSAQQATRSLRIYLARAAALRDALCSPITYTPTQLPHIKVQLHRPKRLSITNLKQACTDPLIVLRDRHIARTAPRIIPRFASARPLPAAAGMGLAAIAREQPSSTPESLLRILSTDSNPDKGPRRIGIGILPPIARSLLAIIGTICAVGTFAAVIFIHPSSAPWLIIAVTICFATRPDRDSFLTWAKQCAPQVAKKKKIIGDKIRAYIAPYFMMLRPLAVNDYGLFSVVTFKDNADYVYVYAGFLSRWCLLGWYNIQDDYNFDKIRTLT